MDSTHPSLFQKDTAFAFVWKVSKNRIFVLQAALSQSGAQRKLTGPTSVSNSGEALVTPTKTDLNRPPPFLFINRSRSKSSCKNSLFLFGINTTNFLNYLSSVREKKNPSVNSREKLFLRFN
ncbi:hypothetical protein HYC85_001590 [Camellia sinensis]|uniref:Uncharacterized protein n=1 Tax=Camellia sinensis TaxID=4442 RepID=A0A7J7I748_CAMSI|nr:hypothetical protein HYC85_001590 [Camellia sinensis]